MPPAVSDFDLCLDPYAPAILDDALRSAIISGSATARRGLNELIRRTDSDGLS